MQRVESCFHFRNLKHTADIGIEICFQLWTLRRWIYNIMRLIVGQRPTRSWSQEGNVPGHPDGPDGADQGHRCETTRCQGGPGAGRASRHWGPARSVTVGKPGRGAMVNCDNIVIIYEILVVCELLNTLIMLTYMLSTITDVFSMKNFIILLS